MRRDLDHFRNRTRRTLLWCVLTLCISPVPGGWLIDHCPLHIRFPQAAATISSWEKANPRPNILILGSSRLGSFVLNAELAAMTKELVGNDSAHFFNSTIPGGDPITLEFLTRRLLASKSGVPRLVVLETNLDLLARDNLYFKFVIAQLMTAADIPKYLGDILLYHAALSRLLGSRLTPFFLHRSHLLAWADEVVGAMFTKNKSQGDESQQVLDRWQDRWQDWQPSPSPSPGKSGSSQNQQTQDKSNQAQAKNEPQKNQQPQASETSSASSAKDDFANDQKDVRLRLGERRFENHLRHYELAGTTPAAFESTIAMLRAYGCTVLLVEPPLSSAHHAYFTTAMQTQFEAFVQRLHNSYGCQFFDYSDRLPDSHFSDYHHGNAEGCTKFTELLAREVVAPEWRNLEAKKRE